jgi:hypothetical protein
MRGPSPFPHDPYTTIRYVMFQSQESCPSSQKISFGISNKTTQFSWRITTFIDKTLDNVKVSVYFTIPLQTTGWSVPLVVLTLNGIVRWVYEENSLAIPVTCSDANRWSTRMIQVCEKKQEQTNLMYFELWLQSKMGPLSWNHVNTEHVRSSTRWPEHCHYLTSIQRD